MMELPVDYHKTHFRQRKLVREEYARLQNNLCCHCGAPLSGDASKEVMEMEVNKSLFPDNFFKWPIHLHHSHETGMTIGTVHNYCNAVLWQYHGQ